MLSFYTPNPSLTQVYEFTKLNYRAMIDSPRFEGQKKFLSKELKQLNKTA